MAEENDGVATQLGATDEAIDVCEATGTELRPRYGGEFVKRIEP